jgi:hypothetical protein
MSKSFEPTDGESAKHSESTSPPNPPQQSGNGIDPAIAAAATGTIDDFDKFLRKPGSAAAIPTKPLITRIRVGKPPKHAFFRSHPDWQHYTQEIEVIIDEQNFGEEHLVAPAMDAHLSTKLIHKIATLCITMQKALFISTVRLPDQQTGRTDPFNESMLAAMREARSQWVAVENKGGEWGTQTPIDMFPDPEWPDITMREVLKIGFRGRLVENLDHPLVKRLLGIK